MADGYTYLGTQLIGRSYEMRRKYFTIKILTSSTFYIGNSNIQKRVDGGSWESAAQFTQVAAGQVIELKGDVISGNTFATPMIPSCEVYGNVLSLFYGDNFASINIIPTYYNDSQAMNYSAMISLFAGVSITDASGLLLPSPAAYTPPSSYYGHGAYYRMFAGCTSLTAPPVLHTELSKSCYAQMFDGCTSLTTAPELPATELVNNCYYRMFRGCSALNYVKCLAENPDNSQYSNYTENWLDGVASSGAFVKPSSVSTWYRGASGIPTGWTVQSA